MGNHPGPTPDGLRGSRTASGPISGCAPRVGPDRAGGTPIEPSRDATVEIPSWLHTSAAWTWRLLLLLVAFLAILWLLAKLLVVSLPLIVALILSTLTVPPARWLQRKGLKPAAAAGIVVVGGLALIIGILTALTPTFIDQLSELGATLRQAWEDVLTWLETGPFNYDREQVVGLLESIRDAVTEDGGGLAAGLLSGAAVVAQLVAGLVLLIIVLFFFVKDGEDIVDWFLERTPPRHRDTVVATGRRAWTAMSGYVRGTALIALIDAAGIAVGLLVLRVPLVAPLTVLVFLGGFLPVIGAAAAGLVAVLVALAAGGPAKALLVLAWILVVQQVEGNLLQPTIMRRAVALHPVVILVALTAGAALAGIVGAFLAVPVAAVVAAIGNELRLRAELAASEAGASAP